MNEKMPIKMHRQLATITLKSTPAKMLNRILSAAITTAPTTKVFVTLFILLRICTISSNAVLAAKVSAVSADKPTGQRFAMEPQDQTAIVGSRVTLPCRVVDKVGKLQWTKDDFGLGEHRNLSGFDRYSMVGSDEEGDYSLDIYPVMLDDDARYQCQVGPGRDGQAGIRSRFAELTILVPPEPPKINQGDFMVTTEDREIELECISVGGKPAAEITWIDGLGNVLTNGIEYVKEPLADTRRFTAKSILKLTPKKEHHNTTFTCQAQNTADRNYRSAKLKLEVKYAPKVSVSVIGGALAGGRILEGAEVRLSCRADANPDDLKYHWYINDEVVVGDYTTEMIIHNVTRKYHDAIVKCEVVNAVGKSEETETLDISYGPAFKTYPKSVEADVGATVVMTCDVDGNPQADIVWIYDPKDRVVGTSTNLTVVVSHETAGRYYCKASIQGFPEIGAEASVYVKSPPTITSQRRQYGIEGDNTRLECAAFSVPKARHVSWTYNGKEINTSNDHDYSILEDPLSDGIKSTLIINESQTKHFGRYNCTVVNDYGNDFLEIDLIPSQNIESRIFLYVFAVCAVFLIAVVLISVICLKRGNKKEAPADLIKNHQKNTEKGCKDSDRSSNISDLKIEREHEYSETCSGTDSIATRLNMNTLTGNGLGGVPLAGPVKIPSDYRYSGDYTDAMGHFQSKSGQNNNGYVPYVDYTRDYSPPPQSLTHLRSLTNSSTVTYNSSNNSVTNANTTSSNNVLSMSNHLTQPSNTMSSSSAAPSIATTQLNGQLLSNGNLSLQRNPHRLQELRQDNGLPNLQNSMNSLPNALLGHSTLPNGGLSIDPRYNATYGNPYLRNSNTSTLPGPNTANPAATPLPPPYNPALRNQSGANSSSNSNSLGIYGSSGPGGNLSSSILGISASASPNSNGSSSQQMLSPSGQFILPANGNLKKGALATHV